MASSPRIEELRKKFEENPRRYFAPLANEYRKAGDVQQAIAICREYLPQQPGHMSGHIVFGQALYEARIFEESRAVFETALSLDPENLIALRHLGDIALITGDTDSARTWYKRVLEADPRNEEIQAQLATIDQASASAPTPAITPAVSEPHSSHPTPVAPSSTAPTVVMPAVRPPGVQSSPVTASSPTAEIREIPVAPPSIVDASAEMVEVPPTAAIEGLQATAAAPEEAPIDSFSLDGLQATSLSSDSAPPPPPAPIEGLDFGREETPSEPPAQHFGSAPTVELVPGRTPVPELDIAPTQFEAPAMPATTEVPNLELDALPEPPALDLELGSLETAPAETVAPEPGAQSPAPSPVEQPDEAPLELEISIPTPVVTAATPTAEPHPAPTVEPPEIPAPEPPAAGESSPPSPFMTETMAELYLQQGHREEALKVYRALLAQRPGDTALQGRVSQLESDLAGPGRTGATEGPTIRELLLAIAARRPGYRPDSPAGHGAAQEAVIAESPTDIAPSAHAVPAPDHDATTVNADDGEARGDALGVALGFSGAAGGDEAAAVLLARAFRSNGHSDAPLLVGAPARPAEDELSLRSVFKSSEPAPPPSSFSFDQFFSQRATSEHGIPAPESQAAESAEDVAQFTQWLEGLKRR